MFAVVYILLFLCACCFMSYVNVFLAYYLGRPAAIPQTYSSAQPFNSWVVKMQRSPLHKPHKSYSFWLIYAFMFMWFNIYCKFIFFWVYSFYLHHILLTNYFCCIYFYIHIQITLAASYQPAFISPSHPVIYYWWTNIKPVIYDIIKSGTVIKSDTLNLFFLLNFSYNAHTWQPRKNITTTIFTLSHPLHSSNPIYTNSIWSLKTCATSLARWLTYASMDAGAVIHEEKLATCFSASSFNTAIVLPYLLLIVILFTCCCCVHFHLHSQTHYFFVSIFSNLNFAAFP